MENNADLPEKDQQMDSLWIKRYQERSLELHTDTIHDIRARAEELLKGTSGIRIDVFETIFPDTILSHSEQEAKKILEALKIVYTKEQLDTFATPINPILYECIGSEGEVIDIIKGVCKHFGYVYFGDLCAINPWSFICRVSDVYDDTYNDAQLDHRTRQILYVLASGLHEFDLSLGMSIPGWDKFRPVNEPTPSPETHSKV